MVAQDPIDLPGRGLSVTMTVSIGVAMGHRPLPLPSDPLPQTVETLLHRADKALYGAKACGRNQVTISNTAA